MHHFQILLWIAEKVAEFRNVFEAWFVGFLSVYLIVWRLLKQPRDRVLIFLICHAAKFSKVFGILL
jgi:hypothetical protein